MSLVECCGPSKPSAKEKAEYEAREDAHCLITFAQKREEVAKITKDKKRYKAALEQVKSISKEDQKYMDEEMERMKAKKSGIQSLLSKAKRL